MQNKIYDIIPPETGKEIKSAKRAVQKSFFLKKKTLPILLILILAGAYFLVDSRAEVKIWPKTRNETFNAQLVVDLSGSSENSIQGEVLRTEKTVSQDFNSSETKTIETNAHGTVRVYNNYSVYPQSFVAKTRFMSDSGKVFKSSAKIIVPGKIKEGDKWVPGSIDVEIIAAESGLDYNIPASTFSIPGLKGTSLYTLFHAESSSPMEGGSISEAVQVNEKDLEEAEEILSEKVLSESMDYLIENIPEDFLIINDLISSKVVEFLPLAQIGQEVESFTAKAKAESSGIIFKKSDFDDFVKSMLVSNIEDNEEFYLPSMETEYSFLKRDENENIVLNLVVSSLIYEKNDIDKIKRNILGKEAEEAKRDILNNFSGVEKIEIKIAPFWKNKVPLKSEYIEAVLQFNQL